MNPRPSISDPVFILGNNRSGTTLLRLMLTNHSKLIIPPESHFFLWLRDEYKNWIPSDGIREFLQSLTKCTKIETWNLSIPELEAHIHESQPANYGDLIASVYFSYGHVVGKNATRWGDKNSLWVAKLNDIVETYPDAVIVHIVRDGRDVACSYLELARKDFDSVYAPRLPNDVTEIASIWSENVSAVRAFGKRLPRGQYIECRYEELLTYPAQVVREICRVIRLPYEKSMVAYRDNQDSTSLEPAEFLPWKQKILQPLDPSNCGKYLRILTRDQIATFELIAGETLVRFDYALNVAS